MDLVGITVGIFVFFLVNAICGDVMLHNAQAGIFPGLVAAIWAAWPFFHLYSTKCYNLLHPAPRKYPVNAQNAFTRIYETLKESTYNYGDKWHIVTADISRNRIVADFRYAEDELHLQFDKTFRTRTTRVQRYIGLEVQLEPAGSFETIIQLDFAVRTEGRCTSACDAIIADLQTSLDCIIGHGVSVAEPLSARLSTPPWWLVTLTALMLITLINDIWHNLSPKSIANMNQSAEQQLLHDLDEQHLQQIEGQRADYGYFTKFTIDPNLKAIDHFTRDLPQLEDKIVDPHVSQNDKSKPRDFHDFLQHNRSNAQQELASALRKLTQLTAHSR